MIKKLLQSIGNFFNGLFNAAQRAWNSLPPETRQAIVHGSSLLDQINRNIDMSAEDLAKQLQQQFPEIGADKLSQIAAQYGLQFSSTDYTSIVGALQKYLKPLQGKFWALASSAIAKGIAILTAPEGTKFAVVDLLTTWAYHRFVKQPEVPAPAQPVPAPNTVPEVPTPPPPVVKTDADEED